MGKNDIERKVQISRETFVVKDLEYVAKEDMVIKIVIT